MSECKLCNKDVDNLNDEIEHAVMELIKKENPEWVEADGACNECLNYYSDLDNIVEVL